MSSCRLKLILEYIKSNEQWEDFPEGWDQESLESFWESLGSSVTSCIEKMEGKVDDPGAFCASLKDVIKGDTGWRGD